MATSISQATLGQVASNVNVPACDYLTVGHVTSWKGLEWLIDVTDDTEQGEFNLVAVQRAAELAQGEVDTYLAKRYSTPVVSTPASAPAALRVLTVKVLIYRLASRRDDVDASVRQDFEDALAQLEAIAAGKSNVPGLSSKASALPQSNHRKNNTDPLFSLTRQDKDGNDIDLDESGTLDTW